MKVKVNRGGKVLIALTILLGIAAVNTGNNLLYMVVSYLLSGMLISGFVSLMNLRNISVSVRFPDEVYEGKPVKALLSVRKEGRFPSFLISVESKDDRVVFPTVEGKARSAYLRFVFKRRGLYEKVRLKVSSDFPLGMFTRFYFADVKVNLVVFPKPKKARLRSLSGEKKGSETPLSLLRKGYEEVKDVRDYTNEPMKLIHWKLSAKSDTLKVKDMLSRESPSLVLSLESVEGDTEERLRALSYLISELMERGYAVGLRLGRSYIPPGKGKKHKLRLLREIALFESPETSSRGLP
ncbi:MAG: DUF58 domain-containing protein [Aquificae bacterium]|nr:DUF58 domain-containing protein [Aquificota bacterium]